MKKLLFIGITLFSIVVFSSCSKDDDISPEKTEQKKDCEINKYGTIVISNSSSNPYNIYIDNSFIMRLNGGGISTPITINQGNNRQLYAEQVSGYLFTPTVKTTYFNVVSCSEYSWQIP